jgi:hypothetical protein
MSVLFFWILFLHIATMFMAVTISYGGVIFLIVALHAGRSEAVRSITAAAKPIGRLVPVFYFTAGAFGLIAAIVNNFNLLAPWLIIAYVLFALLTILGAAITAPTIEKYGVAVAGVPDGPLPREAIAMNRRFYQVEVIDFLLLFLVIFDMVVKPFS